jgi:hypothetical protein
MTLHSSTHVPVDDSYAALLGKAVYVFAYYEWAIVYAIEYLRADFVRRYTRITPMTSGAVRQELQAIIDDPAVGFTKVTRSEMQSCCDEFERLIHKRNALIHAHPITDKDGAQILAYQTKPSKPLPNMKWPTRELESVIQEFDGAAVVAGRLLERLRAPDA